jgi:L-seryl-tRNA(Ser) seleniumtransferase
VPAQTLPTRLLAIHSPSVSAEELAKQLRLASPPVISRIHHEAVCLDFRTILPEEEKLLAKALISALTSLHKEKTDD